jgi:hypothetical protein
VMRKRLASFRPAFRPVRRSEGPAASDRLPGARTRR